MTLVRLNQRKSQTMIKIIAFLALMLCMSGTSQADIYDVPKVTTVQNRIHDYSSELTVQGGYLPMDPFTKYISYGGSYTYFFSDFTAWEVVNANMNSPLVSGLRTDLQESFRAEPARFEVLQYHITSNLSFTPLYTKNLLFNSKIVYSEISFVAGAGVASFTSGTKGCIDVGIIMRYFLSRSLALKLDFRNYIYLSSTRNNLGLVLGMAYIFGTKNAEPTIDEFNE
jgi:outer membrane beta-barrel protein